MGDAYYGRPIAVTDERARDALEKQQRQRAVREELDSQREAQREARVRAGLPVSNEPMTRAQRHRQRIAAEQEEMRRNEVSGQPYGAGAHPQSVPPQVVSGDALTGTFGRNANPYQPVRQSASGSLPAIGRPTTNGSLPPIGDHSPRYAPPQVPNAPPPGAAFGDDESVYQFVRKAQPPTPPQQPAVGAFQRHVPPTVTAPAMPAPSGARQFGGTLSRAPPPGANQEELALWLNQATEEIRRVRGELGDQPPVSAEVASLQRGRGPATRGAKVDGARDVETPSVKPVRGASNQRTSSNQRARAPAVEDVKRVAKLEATLAGQMEEMRRMQKQQQEWQSQVDRLNRELKNARVKEKHLSKAVIDKTAGVKERRAETAPKPSLPQAARGRREGDRRPITAGVELDPIDTHSRAGGQGALPPLPEELRASYDNRRGLPTPREAPSSTVSPVARHAPPPTASHQHQHQHQQHQHRHAEAIASSHDAPGPSADVTFAQLLKFTEARLLSHKQAQQLWALFSGASARGGATHQHSGHQEIGPDEEFGAPMETVETYEDLMPDDEDDDEYR